jgi:1-deoxy-D-xylulose-5-phosphate reductoisomerase
MQQGVTVLGRTGSIGVNTLDVVARHPERYRVVALTAHRNIDLVFAQALQFNPEAVVLLDVTLARDLGNRLQEAGSKVRVLCGTEALCEVCRLPQVELVMAAIVGAAGLLPTLAAVKAGKRVLLANKESLVMGGHLFMQAVADHGASLLPIDSEHNAIFQCLPAERPSGLEAAGVARILLTGSGGPFRTTSVDALTAVTPEQACAHPNWSMGRKISVDSATMMNKGLEFIEACLLFAARPDQVQVVVHPQSVVHSMVEYTDGSVLAQLGHPDMRTPIAYGMAWPERIDSGVPLLDLVKIGQLSFEAPDERRFPCLVLAREAYRAGDWATIALNAANEVAVEAFLGRKIRFTDIADSIAAVLGRMSAAPAGSLEDILGLDAEARALTRHHVDGLRG